MILNTAEANRLRNTLIATVDIVQYLKRHVLPKIPHRHIDMSKIDPYAVQVSMLCPFHDETQPSFRLYAKGSSAKFTDAYCFGSCRRGGGPIQIHMMNREILDGKKLSYVEALIDLAELYNIKHAPLFVEESETISPIKESGITLDDILGQLNAKDVANEEPVYCDNYGMHLTLIESRLKYILTISKDTYIHYATELDYLMSLGIHDDELTFELSSLDNEMQLIELKFREEQNALSKNANNDTVL